MTAQEYSEEDKKLEMRARQIKRQRQELKERYIQSLPIKEGDRIALRGRDLGWYMAADTSWNPTRLDIMYNPPKKDGSRSRHLRYEHGVSIEEIEIINK